MIAVVVAHECEVTNAAMWHVPQYIFKNKMQVVEFKI